MAPRGTHGRPLRLHDRPDYRGDGEKAVLDRTLACEPYREALQSVNGGAVRSLGAEDVHLVELPDDAGGRLAVTAPCLSQFNLGGDELACVQEYREVLP